jgi:hypothetical protein
VQIGMFGEPFAGALRHSRTEAFHQTSHPVDQLRASLDDQVPRPHQVQIPLRVRAAMPDRRKQRRLGPSHLGQRPRVFGVVLFIAGGEQSQPPRIRHDHLVTAFGEQRAHPSGVRPGFQRDHRRRHPAELLPVGLGRRSQLSFAANLACVVQNTIATGSIAHIDANRKLSRRFNPDMLFHGRSPLHLECVHHGEPFASRRRPTFSSHSLREILSSILHVCDKLSLPTR